MTSVWRHLTSCVRWDWSDLFALKYIPHGWNTVAKGVKQHHLSMKCTWWIIIERTLFAMETPKANLKYIQKKIGRNLLGRRERTTKSISCKAAWSIAYVLFCCNFKVKEDGDQDQINSNHTSNPQKQNFHTYSVYLKYNAQRKIIFSPVYGIRKPDDFFLHISVHTCLLHHYKSHKIITYPRLTEIQGFHWISSSGASSPPSVGPHSPHWQSGWNFHRNFSKVYCPGSGSFLWVEYYIPPQLLCKYMYKS